MKNLLKYRISYPCEKLIVILKSCFDLIFFHKRNVALYLNLKWIYLFLNYRCPM